MTTSDLIGAHVPNNATEPFVRMTRQQLSLLLREAYEVGAGDGDYATKDKRDEHVKDTLKEFFE